MTNKPTGTGLGLALVAKIINDHGGAIEFESEPGRTTFRVMLPLQELPRPPHEQRLHHPDRRRRWAIRTVLHQALGRQGHNVRSTGAAATLWQWVQEGEGQLVITDAVMPDENGLDLAPRIS